MDTDKKVKARDGADWVEGPMGKYRGTSVILSKTKIKKKMTTILPFLYW